MKLTKMEMMAVRLFRGYNRFQFAKMLGVSEGTISSFERGRKEVPDLIIRKYFELLQIKPNELKRIRAALSGETKGIEIDREIPQIIKDEVRKRDKNECVNCGYNGQLHFHHKKRFSEGGLHTADNIILLCPDCHAEEHVGEICYALLKNMAKKKSAR